MVSATDYAVFISEDPVSKSKEEMSTPESADMVTGDTVSVTKNPDGLVLVEHSLILWRHCLYRKDPQE